MELIVKEKEKLIIRKFKDNDELMRWCDAHVTNEWTRKALAIPVMYVNREMLGNATMISKQYINQLLKQAN